MLLSLLPTAAMAATEITEVRLQIDQPEAGKPADFTPEGENEQFGISSYSENGYHNGVWWIDQTENGKALQPGDVFEMGHTYMLRIATYAKSGYAMTRKQLDSAYQWYVTGYINDQVDDYPAFRGDSNEVYFTATFQIPIRISSVAIESVTAPVPGALPDYRTVLFEHNYYVSTDAVKGNFHNGVYWFDKTENEVVPATVPFVEGHEYRVFIDVLAGANKYFSTNDDGSSAVSATVNGEAAKVVSYLSEPASQEINVYYDFGVCEPYAITRVDIAEVEIPAQGKSPDYSVVLEGYSYDLKPDTQGNPFRVNGVRWHDDTEDYDLTATHKFIAGHTYTVNVSLIPANGFRFTEDVIATIDDAAATVTKNGSEIEVRYTYPALVMDQITEVAIEGVSAPVLNQHPSYVALVRGKGYGLMAKNDDSFRNGMRWSVMDGESLPVTGGTFVGGKTYQVEILLATEEGYAFDPDINSIKATVNGKPVTAAFREGGLLLTCYFPEPTDEAQITTVAVDGLSAPVIGAAPDYTAQIVDTRYALLDKTTATEKNGITWINNTTGNAMRADSDKFEAGTSYTAVIGLQSRDGYAFPLDKQGDPQVTAYLNERAVDEVTAAGEYTVYLRFTFAALPESAFTDVPADAYYYAPVMWAVANGITNGTGDGSTFSPDMNCTRAQVVTFLWRAAGSPAPKSREMPFTDVPAGSYYADAVLWAVENNITTGTGTGTTFSPDMICTRAQIVTFLYRCMG